jgi:DNA-directed RNA polymerase subunit RPC12/RpoP
MKKKSDDSSYWGKSLRALPWDKKEKTHSQTLISSTVHEWYDAKHRETSFEEIELINSIIINSCPYCGSARFIKAGHNGLLQRYKCSECDGRFSALTNTIFDSNHSNTQGLFGAVHKHRFKTFQDHALRTNCSACGNLFQQG